MGDLTDSDILDLTRGTLSNLDAPNFGQIATRLQHYEVMGKLLKNDKMEIQSGTEIKRTLMIDHSGAARNVGLHATDNVNIGEVLQQITIPWRRATSHFAYERREILENSKPSQVVNLMTVRRADAMISMAELLEDAFWSAPTTSDDKLKPFGVPYYLVKNATAGFNGGNPTGFSSGAGGLSSTTFTRWANYTAGYATNDKTDLLPKMRTGYRKINFKSPVDIPDLRRGKGQVYRLYCNETSLAAFENVGEAQNDNLGRDLASMDDQMTFRRNPIVWIPKLDADTSNPIYMINLDTFYPVVLKGDYLRESDPEKADGQHNTFVVFYDLSWNILCVDRRANAVFYIN